MKIGEAAKALDVSVQTLRFYEKEGLLSTGKTGGGTRHYTGEDLERLRAIRTLAGLDIPLDVIRTLADTRLLSDTGDQACRSVGDQLDRITARLHNLQKLIDATLSDIRQARRLVDRCVGCNTRPTRKNCATCPVSAGLDQAQILQLIWDQDHED